MIAPAPDGRDGSLPGAPRLGEMQGTISAQGGRVWLYPREVGGRFMRARTLVAWILLAAYMGLPWIQWRGLPLVALDPFSRRLSVLGHFYWANDIPLFIPGFFALVLVAILATARLGRIWCGWACPQTVFLHFLFGPAERLIEGKASARKKRDAGPANASWIARKAAKHAIFLFLSLWIGNTALAYFWGMDNLIWAIAHPSPRNLPGLLMVIAFTAVFYYVFAFFREQACIMLCPYARFQSVLLDESTSLIAYDEGRGEPKGKGPQGVRTGLGDCTDCRQCVLVCPTGIDIRQGQQMECIGCARCIDACDRTMAAWKKPAGLVRYASLRELQGKPKAGFPWRLAAYGALAAAMGSASLLLLARRPDVSADLVRRGSAPYEAAAGDSVRNAYTLHLRNNGARRVLIRLGWDGTAPGTVNWQGREFALAGGGGNTLPIDITVPASAFDRGRLDARLLLSGDGVRETIPIGLAGPWGTSRNSP